VRRHAVRLLAAAALTVVASCGDDDVPERAAARMCRPAPLRTGELTLDVEDLVAESPDGSVDTDGDGRDDEVASGLVIRRGDGELRFPGAELRTSGDLDGDGRDDLVLHVGERDVAVDGRTPAGSHDPLEVGVPLGPRLTYIWPDDLDGRPGFDFADPVRDGEPRTLVWSGAEVLAADDARDLEPARTLPGLPRAVVALEEGAEPETVLLVPGERTSLRFVDRPNVELRTDRRAARVEDVKVFDEDGGRRIALVVDRHVSVWAAPPRC